nr:MULTISPECIES: PAS domain-containing protein [Halorhodospira]
MAPVNKDVFCGHGPVGVLCRLSGYHRRINARVDRLREQAPGDAPSDAQTQLSLLREALGAGFWQLDLDSGRVTADAQLLALYGYPGTDASADHAPWTEAIWREHVHPEDWARVEACYRKAFDHYTPWDLTYRIRRPNGEIRHLRSVGRVECDAEGNPTHLVGLEHDVTEQERQRQARDQALERAGRTEKIGAIGHWVAYPETGKLIWSPMTYELCGFDPKGPPPDWESFIARVAEGYRDQVAEFQFENNPSLLSCEGEYRIVHPGGRTLWVREIAQRWQDEHGQWIIQGTIQDITEQREALDRSDARRQELESILEAIPGVSVAQVDLDGVVREASRSAEWILGCSRDELIGKSFLDFHKPGDRAQVAEAVNALQKAGQSHSGEYELIRGNGERFRAQVNVVPLLDERGQVVGRIGACIDLSTQFAHEQRLCMAQEAAGFGVWEWDVAADRATWDAASWRMLGFDPEQQGALTYAQWRDLVHPEDLERILPTFERHLFAGTPFTMEFRYRCADGSWLWVQNRGQTLRRGADGSPIYMVGTHVDIQQIKEAEHALREHERDLREVKRIARLGHWILDVESKSLFCSGEVYELFGIDPREKTLDLETYLARILEPDRSQLQSALEQALSGQAFEVEHRITGSDDSERILLGRGYTELDAWGQPRMVRGTTQDVTEQRTLQHQLTEALKAKNTFLNAVSHDLRNPLNALTGFMELLAEPNLDEEQRQEYVKHCRRASARLLELIDSLLDLGRLQAGRLELRPAPFDLHAAIESQRSVYDSLAREHGLVFSCSIDPGVPQSVEADATRLGQILSNLLSNAIKYTHEGQVDLTVCAEPDERISFRVRDTGPGLSPEDQEHIFAAFDRAGYRGSRSGHGLGLAIVRELTELFGGEISLQSTPGVGSTFTVTLPLPPAAQETERDTDTGVDSTPPPLGGDAPASALNVLVADDEAVNVFLARTLLEQLGCTVTTAEDGASALEAWQTQRFDALVLDLHMPGVDGDELAERIRAEERAQRCTRVAIALYTAHARSEVESVLETGLFDAFLSKPLGRTELRQWIKSLVPRKDPDDGTTPGAPDGREPHS